MICRTALALSSALAVALPAGAQVTTDWDADASGGISRNEWVTGMRDSDTFGTWDANGDEMIESGEFGGGLFDRFDEDGDGLLTRTEWEDGFGTWQGADAEDLDYANWDADGDGQLDRTDFVTGYDSAGLFDRFRTAGGQPTTNPGMTRDEFASGTYDWMDRDGDDNLTEAENRFPE